MPYTDDQFVNMLRYAELAMADIDETWRERWSTMALGERTHYLNVEILDVERYVRELCSASKQGALTADQAMRLDLLASAWERARAGAIVEMARSGEQPLGQNAS